MRVELGDHVVSQDGHDLGTIKHLILDPATEQVKTFVVEKGLLLHDDIELPLSALQDANAAGENIRLTLTAAQVKTLPRFDAGLYTPGPPEHAASYAGSPLGGLLWPAGYVGQPFAASGYPLGAGVLPIAAPMMDAEALNAETGGEADEEGWPDQPQSVRDYRRQEDAANAVISAGDMVVSRDGETVGEAHSVTIDTQTGMPTALVVRKGTLFVQDTTLMADSIASVDDGVITLNLDKNQLPA